MSELHSVFINVKENVLHLQTKPEESVRQTQFDFQILVDLGVHAPTTNVQEPHKAQDLCVASSTAAPAEGRQSFHLRTKRSIRFF